jgi:hypothetical protein
MRNEPIEIIEHKGYKINIYSDDDPANPRDSDNLGHMICFHRRYSLGDEHQMTFDEACTFQRRKDVISLNLYLYDHSGITMRASRSYEGNPFYGHLPQGHAEFDSGQVGFVYVTKDELRREFNKKKITKKSVENAIKIMYGEVEIYDKYIRGDFVGYVIETPDGEDQDSCWGFDDYKYMVEECKAIIDRLKGEVKQDEAK